MKELFIPRGKTVHMKHLEADTIILKGVLNVDETVKARKIIGDGMLHAGHISAKSVTADDIEAGTITAERVVTSRMVAVEVRASRACTVGCYLEAGMVDTPKLSVRGHEVQELKVNKLIHLSEKTGSLLWTILSSEVSTALASLRAWWDKTGSPAAEDSTAEAMDADYIEVCDEQPDMDTPDWECERMRLNRIFDLAKDRGYVLRVCTPAEAESPYSSTLRAEASRLWPTAQVDKAA